MRVPRTQVKGLSPEITIVSVADVVHLMEGSTLMSKCRESIPEEPDEGKPQVRFCEGAHGSSGANTPIGGGL